MALAKGKINPLNVIGQRRLPYIPPHFEQMTILDISKLNIIDHWIYQNLNSRYCIKLNQELDSTRKIIETCVIGMEDGKELSMLALSCPHLYK